MRIGWEAWLGLVLFGTVCAGLLFVKEERRHQPGRTERALTPVVAAQEEAKSPAEYLGTLDQWNGGAINVYDLGDVCLYEAWLDTGSITLSTVVKTTMTMKCWSR